MAARSLASKFSRVTAAVRSSLRQLESAFYTLLVDCGADIPLPVSPLLDSRIARRMAEVKATADAALQQMAMARADLVRVSTASQMRQQAEAHWSRFSLTHRELTLTCSQS